MTDEKLASLIGQSAFDMLARFGGPEKIEWFKAQIRAVIQRRIENPHVSEEQLIDEFRKSVAPLIADILIEAQPMGSMSLPRTEKSHLLH